MALDYVGEITKVVNTDKDLMDILKFSKKAREVKKDNRQNSRNNIPYCSFFGQIKFGFGWKMNYLIFRSRDRQDNQESFGKGGFSEKTGLFQPNLT